ncbi:MAG TPA: glucose 1-dehydrogenase [Dehalococcoidia bacterium]|nr:glucose 1-dehydrogenase [Dehalococcoidia bacterium]
MRLAGKVALITGAGSGQGRKAVEVFVREGARVVASDVNAEGLEGTVKLAGAGPESLVTVTGSVADAADVRRMVQMAKDTFGGLHILYNNAGIVDREGDGPVTEVSNEAWDKVLGVNLRGVFYCCKYAIPVMIESGGGSIVNIASGAALVGGTTSAYTASKGGVVALTRAIAVDFGKFGIRCNAICPGVIMTPMLQTNSRFGSESGLVKMARFNPVRRVGEPEDVVNTALFLASDESTFMTGTIIPVDGGATAR